MHRSAKMDAIERILGSGRTRGVSFPPFLNSSGWWWLISSISLIRISCHKTTHANGYYGAWPGWAVSISVLPLTDVDTIITILILWVRNIKTRGLKNVPRITPLVG